MYLSVFFLLIEFLTIRVAVFPKISTECIFLVDYFLSKDKKIEWISFFAFVFLLNEKVWVKLEAKFHVLRPLSIVSRFKKKCDGIPIF